MGLQKGSDEGTSPTSRDLMAATADGGLSAKCTTLLGGVASSGHSDTEVAAFCRAAYTPEMCGTLRASLGRLPWPAAKIQQCSDRIPLRCTNYKALKSQLMQASAKQVDVCCRLEHACKKQK